MPASVGGNVVSDIITSHPPPEVVESTGRNSIAASGDLKDHKDTSYEINSDSLDDEHPAPTEEESRTLRKVADSLPLVSFSLCLVEFAERASYYGAKTVFSNFVQFPLPKGGNGAGAPPRGTQETAGALGWWADVYVGRYKAIVVGVIICGIAHIIQIVGALPSVLQRGKANSAPPFILGLLILAFGAGIFKPNIAPTILDQHRYKKPYTKVIVDPETTTTRTMLIFYGFVNIGAFFMLATTYSEKYVGFWLAFLLAGIIYFLLPVLLAAVYKKTYKAPPRGSSELGQAFRIIGFALRKSNFRPWRKGFWDAAKPSTLRSQGITVDWTDKLVDDVRRTVAASEIFFYFPIWILNDNGIGSVQTNQGASMITNGAPNDLLSNFNALTIIVSVPILTFVIYPALLRYKIKFGRISRITFGFVLAAISGLLGAIVQWKVYKLSPCGYYASTCDTVAPISIWWQIPNVVLGALSECFANVTAYELAYARSPDSMKGLVMAIFLFMQSLSSALGEILIPVTQDPYLIWIWGAPAVALTLQTILFWFRFKHLNDDAFMTHEEDYESQISLHRDTIEQEKEEPKA